MSYRKASSPGYGARVRPRRRFFARQKSLFPPPVEYNYFGVDKKALCEYYRKGKPVPTIIVFPAEVKGYDLFFARTKKRRDELAAGQVALTSKDPLVKVAHVADLKEARALAERYLPD